MILKMKTYPSTKYNTFMQLSFKVHLDGGWK